MPATGTCRSAPGRDHPRSVNSKPASTRNTQNMTRPARAKARKLHAYSKGRHQTITRRRHLDDAQSMQTKPGHAALRKGRCSIEGQIYLLTSVTSQRRTWFADTALAEAACHVIHSTATWGDAQLLCWVLMPDHWHGLVQLGRSDLASAMSRFKSLSARTIPKACHPLWMHGFHDHALRREENVLGTARYIVANPIRAGLVRRVRDYRWWGSVWAPEAGFGSAS
jgi:putative transposase